jgi:tRNA pseudouridine38-40 synthase
MNPQSKLKLTIAYDGTDYHGWQIQAGLKTVQGCLCHAAQAFLQQAVHVQGAGRTDRGVHAQGQVAVIETVSTLSVDDLVSGLNGQLPRDISVLEAQAVAPDFDVMRDVTQKHYRYTICTNRVCLPNLNRFCWHIPATLDADSMHAAAQHLVGTHDFRSFAISVHAQQNTTRSVSRCDVSQDRDQHMIHIDIEGKGFLHHMVRIITGTLVDIGRGHWRPEQIVDILEAKKRRTAGRLAPARGLCLERIDYGEAQDRHAH